MERVCWKKKNHLPSLTYSLQLIEVPIDSFPQCRANHLNRNLDSPNLKIARSFLRWFLRCQSRTSGCIENDALYWAIGGMPSRYSSVHLYPLHQHVKRSCRTGKSLGNNVPRLRLAPTVPSPFSTPIMAYGVVNLLQTVWSPLRQIATGRDSSSNKSTAHRFFGNKYLLWSRPRS